MKNDWKEYLNKFENQILLPLFESGDFLIKPEPVPLRAGKLRKSQFAIFVGADFKYKDILSFNYYGLFKPSTALLQTKPKIPNSSALRWVDARYQTPCTFPLIFS